MRKIESARTRKTFFHWKKIVWTGMCWVFLLFCASLLAQTNTVPDQEKIENKKILVLSSYHLSHTWSHQVYNYLVSGFTAKGQPNEIDCVELSYINGVRKTPEEAWNDFSQALEQKKYDVIVTLLGVASSFITTHYQELPASLPIVFCGSPTLPDDFQKTHPYITGIVGDSGIMENLQLGLKLMPRTQEVLIATGASSTNGFFYQLLQKQLADFKTCKVTVLFASDTSTQELLTTVENLPNDSFVILSPWYRYLQDGYPSLKAVAREIARLSPHPYFVTRNDLFGSGTLGGYITHPDFQGISAVKLLRTIFSSPDPKNIPFVENVLSCIIDEKTLIESELNPKLLPPETMFINRNPSFWNLYNKELVFVFIIMFLVVSLLIQAHLGRAKIKKNARRTNTVLEALPVRIVVTTLQGKVIFFQVEKELRDEFPSSIKELSDLPGLNAEHIRKAIARVFQTHTQLTAYYEYKGKKRMAVYFPVSKEIYGEEAVMWVSQDVSQLEAERSRMQELEEQQRVTLESIGDGLVATDANGNVTFLNRVATALTGYAIEEVRGRTIEEVFDIISYTTGKKVTSPVREVLATGKTVKLANHTDLISKSGSRYHVADSAAPILGADKKIKGVVLVFRDVTTEYEQRDRIKNSLLTLRYATRMANISHFRFNESLEKTPFDPTNEISNWMRNTMGDIVPPEQWIYQDDFPRFQKALLALKNREVSEVQLSYRSNYTGSMRYYNLMAARQDTESELEPEVIFGVIQDVTDLNESERKFNDANALLRKIVDTLPCPLFVKDATNGFRYEMANRNFADTVVRLPRKEILGKDDFEIFGNRQLGQKFRDDDEKTLKVDGPYSFVEKVGDLYIKTVKNVFTTSDNRKLLIGFGVDITEIESAKQKKEDSILLLQSILENLPASIAVKDVDRDFRYLIWNRELENQTGISAAEIIGKNDFEISPFPENTDSFVGWDLQVAQTGKPALYTEWCKTQDGKEVVYRTSKSLLKTESGKRLILVLSLDITRQTTLEEERLGMIESLTNYVNSGRIINQCLQKVIVDTDFSEVINQMLSIIGNQVHADRSYVFKYDSEKDIYRNIYEWTLDGIEPQIANLQNISGAELIGLHTRLRKNEDIIISDINTPPDYLSKKGEEILLPQKIQSLLIAGIWVDNQLWGFLGLDFVRSKHNFSDTDIRTLHDAANIFQLAYKRMCMTDELNNYIKNERIINGCLQQVVVEGDFDKVVNSMLETIGKSVNASYCFVMSYNEAHIHYSSRFVWGSDGRDNQIEKMQNVPVEEVGFETLEILRAHEDIEILDVEAPPSELKKLATKVQQLGMSSLLITGIWIRQKLWGFLGIATIESKQKYSKSDLQTVHGAANIFQLAYERNEQVQAIAESAHFRDQLFQNICIPVLVLNTEREIVIANESASKLFGASISKMVGSSCDELFCKRQWTGNCQSELCPLNGVYQTSEKDVRSFAWEGKYLQAITQPIFDLSGNILYVLQSLVDLTDINENQRRLEKAMIQAQSAERAKSTFLATMSHEIRTPLNAIIGFSDMLCDPDTDMKEQSEYIHSINFAGKALLNLINDVLDLSKIEAEQITLVPSQMNFIDLIEEVLAIFKFRFTEKNLKLNFNYPTPMPLLSLDSSRMRQILLNILGNAVKFTNQGSVSVQVSFEPLNAESCNLELSVTDTGIGISHEYQKSVFEPFVRQEDSVRGEKVYEGTGLGLAITQRLVKKMGGELLLESEPGKGSTFKIILKNIGYVFANNSEAAPIEAPQSKAIRSGLHILLVDDVMMNLKVLESMLKKLQVEFTSVTSGQAALDLLQKENFDAVLTDIWMPGMNGDELAAVIRNLPGYESIKIFAITADIEASIDFNLKDFDEVLHKPLVREKLQAILSTL